MPAEQQTNYEILEANKKAVIDFADNIKTKPVLGIKAITAKQREAKALLETSDFSSAIEKLNEIKDNKLGIIWHESEDLGNGTKAVVRDARAVTEIESDLKHDAGEKYGMQILNEVRAGMNLIDQAGLPEQETEQAKQKLMLIATTAIDNVNDLGSDNIKTYNTQIIHVLDEANIPYKHTVNGEEKEISSAIQLNFAKELTSLNDEHRHIVTLTTAKDKEGTDHTVMEADIMLNGLTDGQKKQYEDIANSTPKDPCGVEWFDNMPSHKQNLLRNVAADIASGKKIIPTQLLSDVAGLRNAYQKVTAIKSPDETKSKILLESLHCGAPATKIKVVDKEKKQEIVDVNIQQLQSYAKPGEKINLNILNSETPLDNRMEDFIFNQVRQGVKNNNAEQDKQTSASASPINKWRFLGAGRDTKQFQNNLSKIGEALEKKSRIDGHATENISKYLKNGSSVFDKIKDFIPLKFIKSTKTKAKEELEEIKLWSQLDDDNKSLPNFAKDIETAMQARSLVDTPLLLTGSENVNLDVTALMLNIQNSVKHGELGTNLGSLDVKAYPVNINFCKSGKDRTGYVEMKQSKIAVLNHLGIEATSEEGRTIFKNQVAGGHTQEMAGIQGGTVGCHSIKTNLEFSLNKEHAIAEGIVNQNSAKFNSKIKVEKKENQTEIIEKFEESYEKSAKSSTAEVKEIASQINLDKYKPLAGSHRASNAARSPVDKNKPQSKAR